MQFFWGLGAYLEPCKISKMGLFCKNNYWLSAVGYFRLKLHLRCLTGFRIRLWVSPTFLETSAGCRIVQNIEINVTYTWHWFTHLLLILHFYTPWKYPYGIFREFRNVRGRNGFRGIAGIKQFMKVVACFNPLVPDVH